MTENCEDITVYHVSPRANEYEFIHVEPELRKDVAHVTPQRVRIETACEIFSRSSGGFSPGEDALVAEGARVGSTAATGPLLFANLGGFYQTPNQAWAHWHGMMNVQIDRTRAQLEMLEKLKRDAIKGTG